MPTCRGWISVMPCSTCGSESIAGSPPRCLSCGTHRMQGEALRCEQPLEVGGARCEACAYPSGRPHLISTVDEYAV